MIELLLVARFAINFSGMHHFSPNVVMNTATPASRTGYRQAKHAPLAEAPPSMMTSNLVTSSEAFSGK